MPLGEPSEKFECQNCGCKQSKVRKTEVIDRTYRLPHSNKERKVTYIKRQRLCRHCGLSFMTVEVQHEDMYNHDIPHDSAVRPLYDYGRAVGSMEVINGLVHPSEAQPVNPFPPLAAAQDSDVSSPTDGRSVGTSVPTETQHHQRKSRFTGGKPKRSPKPK